MKKITYIPRNDFVLIEVVRVPETDSGIAVPDDSIEGKAFIVRGIGPKVEGLKVGDQVFPMGRKHESYWELPNRRDLLVLKQECVAVIIEKN